MEGSDATTIGRASRHQRTRHVLGATREGGAPLRRRAGRTASAEWRQTVRLQGVDRSGVVSSKEKVLKYVNHSSHLIAFVPEQHTAALQGCAMLWGPQSPAAGRRSWRGRSEWDRERRGPGWAGAGQAAPHPGAALPLGPAGSSVQCLAGWQTASLRPRA